jgi:hypothetical protein
MGDMIKELLHYTVAKKKMNTRDYNLQELWDMIKRPNLRIHRVEVGAEILAKGIGDLCNETIAENSPNLCNNIV